MRGVAFRHACGSRLGDVPRGVLAKMDPSPAGGPFATLQNVLQSRTIAGLADQLQPPMGVPLVGQRLDAPLQLRRIQRFDRADHGQRLAGAKPRQQSRQIHTGRLLPDPGCLARGAQLVAPIPDAEFNRPQPPAQRRGVFGRQRSDRLGHSHSLHSPPTKARDLCSSIIPANHATPQLGHRAPA